MARPFFQFRAVLTAALFTAFSIAAPWAAVGAETAAKPLTDEECQEFATAVERSVAQQDAEAFSNLIDWDRLVDRATSSYPESPVNAQVRAALKKSTRDEALHPTGICTQIIALAGQGANYRSLRIHKTDDKTDDKTGDGQRCLFRLLMPGGTGFNYHDYVLARRANGRPIAVDVFITASGEMLSEAFRRAFAPNIAEATKGLGRLAGPSDEQIVHAEKIIEMAVAVGQRRFASALEIYKDFPDGLKQEKNLLLLRLRAAQAVNAEEYQSCLEDYRQFHPDDIALDLLLIDYYVLKEEYKDALNSIDRVEESIDGDPHLNLVRANIFFLDRQLPAAREAAKKAIEDEPGLLNAHWVLITVCLAEKDFDATLDGLRRIKSTFGIRFGDLTKVPEYAEFVKSPQYEEWLKSNVEAATP